MIAVISLRLDTRSFFANGTNKHRIEKVNEIMKLSLNVPWLCWVLLTVLLHSYVLNCPESKDKSLVHSELIRWLHAIQGQCAQRRFAFVGQIQGCCQCVAGHVSLLGVVDGAKKRK